MLHAYWGDGKGKTCAAMGLVVRAAAAGWRVVVVQFLKDGSSSEISLLKGLPGVEAVLSDGVLAKFTFRMSDEEKAASRVLHDDNLRRAPPLPARRRGPRGHRVLTRHRCMWPGVHACLS